MNIIILLLTRFQPTVVQCILSNPALRISKLLVYTRNLLFCFIYLKLERVTGKVAKWVKTNLRSVPGIQVVKREPDSHRLMFSDPRHMKLINVIKC